MFARIFCRLALAALACAAAGSVAFATPLTTDAGNPVANWVYFPNGVTVPILGMILPPGSAYEDGTGPPGRVLDYVVESDPDAATQAAIIAKDRADHPSIPAAGSSNPTNKYDCHGLTFKSGNLWIDDDQVDKILTDQGWKPAPAGTAKVGDIVVYRDAMGKVTHSGTVTMVDAQGNVTQVFSKWGARGDYKHGLTDVPASYGTPEVRTGGKPLKDPSLNPEDVNVFQGHVPPPLKPALTDFNVNPDAPTNRNTSPIPRLSEMTHGPVSWSYGLTVPPQGLQISPGDKVDLFATNWSGGQVLGTAALSTFGGWQVQSVSPTDLTFIATTSASIPGNFSGLIDGFLGQTPPTAVGEIVYTEAIADHVGLVSGPVVPEPAAATLIACVVAIGLLRRR